MNINITNLTNSNGPPTYTSVANNIYNNYQKFFDNSVINKLNQDNSILSSNKNVFSNEIEINNDKKVENFNQEKNFTIKQNAKNNDANFFTFEKDSDKETKDKYENTFNSTRKLEIHSQGKHYFETF